MQCKGENNDDDRTREEVVVVVERTKKEKKVNCLHVHTVKKAMKETEIILQYSV